MKSAQPFLGWLRWTLASTHLLWAVALTADSKFSEPSFRLLSLIHLAVSILMATRFNHIGSALSFSLLSYYWLFVKPLEPIAEPQSVGLIAPSLALAWSGIPRLPKHVETLLRESLTALVIRLGVAYPFLEWGLDALRNPSHFYSYLLTNPQASRLVEPLGLQTGTLLLGVFEASLAALLVAGLFNRWSSLTAYGTLILFTLVAGYPLAFPQNLALSACTIFLFFNGAGRLALRAGN